MQGNALMAPILAKAARKLGIDEVADPSHQRARRQGEVRRAQRARPRRTTSTSAFLKQALDKGAELFGWEERKARSGQRNGSKVRGVGVAVSAYSAGSMGFDGLIVIKPDGRMAIQSGIGNLGTESVFDVPSRLCGGGRHPVGEVRRHVGQHGEAPARRRAARAAVRRRMR